MAKFIFIYVTCPNKKTAEKIALTLVKSKIVACANILSPMTSVYSWRGKISRDNETVLILKTTRDNFKAAEKAVLKLHPYECPCIVALPVSTGNKKYLNWLEGQTYR